jgi:hypothetical protein
MINKMHTQVSFLTLFMAALAIGENAMIYNFVERLVKAKCDCSNDWRREAITSMTLFNFVSIMLTLFTCGKKPISYTWFLSLYSIFYFVTVLTYTHKLRKTSCKCAEGLDANIIYYTRSIDALLVIILLTLLFLLVVFRK